jgi:cystathionine beta-lyase
MYNFDEIIERRPSGSIKWNRYPADVLPMWVADTDFRVAPAIDAAIRARVETGIFGYGRAPQALIDQIVADMQRMYGWTIKPEDVLFNPGVVPGFNLVLAGLMAKGDGLALQVPVYPPIFNAAKRWHLKHLADPFVETASGWDVDWTRFAATVRDAKALLFSNPHNPIGKVFTRSELEQVANACLAAGTIIVSDEIHCELLFDGKRHVPIATLSPEVAANTVTLMSGGKTYNIAGLKASWAIIQNKDLRDRVAAAAYGIGDGCNLFGFDATLAALRDSTDWRDASLAYMQANRDHLAKRVAADLPGVSFKPPEATYLAWLDCRALGLPEEPYDFFLREAKVAMNPGPDFGAEGKGFVRLNFGCPRATLDQGIDRLAAALKRR